MSNNHEIKNVKIKNQNYNLRRRRIRPLEEKIKNVFAFPILNFKLSFLILIFQF